MNEIQKKIIEDNGLVEIKEKTRYNAKGQLVYEKYSDGTEYKAEYNDKGQLVYEKYSNGTEYKAEYNDKGQLVYKKYSDGRYYIAGKYYEKKR